MYVTYTRIYGWSDYGGESSYQPGYRLENMMWMTLLVYDYIIPGEKDERNMNKYDKMLELNKKKSEEKVTSAVNTIREMVVEKEKVSIPKLMKKTGLSRGFFYKNPIVRSEIDRALEQQAGMIDPRRTIIDQAMEREMELLQQQVRKLKYENENLKKENEKLKKALARKELNLIKQL